MQLVTIHHSVKEPAVTVGQLVVDVQIPDLPAVGDLGEIAIDPVYDRNEVHVVVSWEDTNDNDRRRGRLGLNQLYNRLKTSRDIVSPCVGATGHRLIADVIRPGEQNNDLGIYSVEFAVLEPPENVLRLIGAPAEVRRVPAEEALPPIG